MRRILFLIAAALTVSLAHAQEVGNVGTSAQLSIIPRIDLNPYIGFNSDAGTDFSLSNSSLYTLLEGSFGEHFSYSIMNHWLSEEPASLYQDTFMRVGDVNWCDWANLTYSFGDFSITAGKCALALGLWEQDAYDYESHFDLNSTLWNNMQVYQWGGDITWNHGEVSSTTLQLVSSPFSDRPFDGGLVSASLLTRRDADEFSYMISGNLVGYDGRLAFIPAEATSGFLKMFNAGLKYCFGDFTLGTDLGWRFCDELHVNESTGALFAEFDPSEKLNLVAKAGYEKCYTTVPFMRELYSTDRRFFGGLAAHYFPLRDNDALRLHAVVAYDNGFQGLSINVGALYNIAIRIY